MKKFFIGLFALLFVGNATLFAASHKKMISSALTYYDKSQNYLKLLLEPVEYEKLYSGDQSYISSFPFHSYTVLHIPSQGYFMDDHINDTIKNSLRANHSWEAHIQKIIKKNILPGTIVLDIGAHIGTHTVTMAQSVGNGSVFAFEPSKKIYRELCMNLALNQCTNVTPIRCALGAEKATIEVVSSHPRNEGGSYVVPSHEGENLAAMIPLDALGLTNVSFIKIDVENMEADVLRGAVQTLEKNRPIMLIEIQGNGERPIQLNEDTKKMHEESIQLIESLGYRLVLISGHDYLAYPE